MTRNVDVLVRLAATAVLLATGPIHAASMKLGGKSISGEVVLKFSPGTPASAVAAAQQAAGIEKAQRLAEVRSGVLWRMSARSRSTESLISALQRNPNVVYVEPNYAIELDSVPGDPQYSKLWGLHNTGQSVSNVPGAPGVDINAEAAWDVTTGSAGIVVGVVDTGIDYNHPDLAANMWVNPGGVGDSSCASGTHGYNAITRTCDPMDDHGHGTHVAGIIGAQGNNGIGGVGVNWTTSIMALKFLDKNNQGTTANAVAAIGFAVQAKAEGVNLRVLNNSWGGGGFSRALLDMITEANERDILFVASAGNSGYDNDTVPHFPSNYDVANVIAVAALDSKGFRSGSNYGASTVDLAAPGANIYSTSLNGFHAYRSGTSMAAPHVSGAAALLLADTPSMTTADVRAAILDNTVPMSTLNGITVSGGRLDAARALGVAAEPGFDLSIFPSTRTVVRGSLAAYSLTISPSGGFSSPVDLSVLELPYGVTATFEPNPATTSTVLTLDTGAAYATYSNIVVTGVSGNAADTAYAAINVVLTPPQSPCPTFGSAFSIGVPSGSTAAAASDFDHDGIVDLVVVHTSTNRVSIMRGLGTGSFQSGVMFNAPGSPIAVAVGDFDRDGNDDLALANSSSNTVSIRLGLGNGSFDSGQEYASGMNPFGIAANDLDGDGDLDLAIANNASGDLTILSGNGDGTFGGTSTVSVGSGPFWIIADDLDRDGSIDLAVALHRSDQIAILQGNGDGTFGLPVKYDAGVGASSIATVDLNEDGATDLVVSAYGSNSVEILLGSTDGTFLASAAYTVGTAPYAVTAMDANGDGNVDVAVANSDSYNVTVLLGNGDGTLGSPTHLSTAYSPASLLSADVDRSGTDDLVVLNDNRVYVLRNTGTCQMNCGTLSEAASWSTGANPKSVVSADFDLNGTIDLASANSGADSVTVTLNDGTFGSPVQYAVGTEPVAVATGDFNRDGVNDLAFANRSSDDVSVLLGNSDGTFQGASGFAVGDAPESLVVADFDRDGKLDLVTANSGANGISMLPGNGDGSFGTASSFGAGTSPVALAAGDFDLDGAMDVVVANGGSSDVSILLSNGDGTFKSATAVGNAASASAIAAADLDRDGKLDLAVTSQGTNTVIVFAGRGDGTFAAPTSLAVGDAPVGVLVEDFSEDGYPDLAVSNLGNNSVSLIFGVGNGSFAPVLTHSAGSGPGGMASGDFNDDGRVDLAVANDGDGALSVLLNACPAPDLTVAKSHEGTFIQGDKDREYTITVSNAGGAATSGAIVYVTDALPAGFSASSMTGAGWNCSIESVTCERNDLLGAYSTYPPISLKANVSKNAPATVINTVTVSGGGELDDTNNLGEDPTSVSAIIDIAVRIGHTGSFVQGSVGREYTVLASNSGGEASTGTVTLSFSLPTGLTPTSLSGAGWSCSLAGPTCSRDDALGAYSAFPPVALVVDVASDAPSKVTTVATISGGGDADPTNNSAADSTTIWGSNECGAFREPTTYDVTSLTSITSGDFNADGVPDLVFTRNVVDDVFTLLGVGDGSFTNGSTSFAEDAPRLIAARDLDRDGELDVVVASEVRDSISILLGNGTGAFDLQRRYTVVDSPNSMVIDDFDRDGHDDIVVLGGYPGALSFLKGLGDGAFVPAVNDDSIPVAKSLVVADFDEDGVPDLAALTLNSLLILEGVGDGTFLSSTPLSLPASNTYACALGDLDDDGHMDIVVSYESSHISVLLGSGDGSFDLASHAATSYYSRRVDFADLNGDGRLDLAVGGGYGSGWQLGNGDGTFQEFMAQPVSSASNYGSVIDDFNGDGQVDVVHANYYGLEVFLGGCNDLVISKSHSEEFVAGKSGHYVLTVSNQGPAASLGTVTVTELLPEGLTISWMSGYGWTCDSATRVCRTNGNLEYGQSFDPISVYVNVAATVPASVTNVATVSGFGESDTSNNRAEDETTIILGPDLYASLSHEAYFMQGGQGTYTISVRNNGAKPTNGSVTLSDALPAGFTPASMSGPGWSCGLQSATCTRSDALAPGSSYPQITLTVFLSPTVPSYVTNTVTVSGGGDVVTSNNTTTIGTQVITRIQNVLATAQSPTQVAITWQPSYYLVTYEVFRRAGTGPSYLIGTSSSTGFVDHSVAPNTTYVYAVRAVSGGQVTSLSEPDVATTILFTDDPLIAGSTLSKAVHITELRTSVNAMRAAAGLAPASFTDPVLTGSIIKAVHLSELRAALDPARSALGLTPISYTDPGLTVGTPIRAKHVQELREAIK